MALAKNHDMVQDWWKWQDEVFEGFKESWGVNCLLQCPIEESLGLLGSSCRNNHPICLGRKGKEMLMGRSNSQVLLK